MNFFCTLSTPIHTDLHTDPQGRLSYFSVAYPWMVGQGVVGEELRSESVCHSFMALRPSTHDMGPAHINIVHSLSISVVQGFLSPIAIMKVPHQVVMLVLGKASLTEHSGRIWPLWVSSFNLILISQWA